MTQETLAELASLNYKYIGRIELGKADPGADVLVRLARALQISVGELFDTITPTQGRPPAPPADKIEALRSALQTLHTAFEQLFSDHPRRLSSRSPNTSR